MWIHEKIPLKLFNALFLRAPFLSYSNVPENGKLIVETTQKFEKKLRNPESEENILLWQYFKQKNI